MPKLDLHDKAQLASTLVLRLSGVRDQEKKEMEVLQILRRYNIALKKGETDPRISKTEE